MSKKFFVGAIIVLFCIMANPKVSEAKNLIFIDPSFSKDEKLIYKASTKDISVLITYTVDSTKGSYLLKAQGKDQLIEATLRKKDLRPIAIHFIKYNLEILTEFDEEGVVILAPQEKIKKTLQIPLSTWDFQSLDYVLRGFPFGKTKRIEFNVLNSGELQPMFSMIYAQIVDEENITVPVGTFSCYKIEIGVNGPLGLFIPKSYYWYAKEKPYYLIKRSRKDSPFRAEETLELEKIE